MRYLTFLTTLLLSTPTFAQEPPSFFQTQKPVLCSKLNTILGIITGMGEKPYAYWTDSDNDTVNLMYVGETGITIIESFSDGNACIIGSGKDVGFVNKSTKSSLTLKGKDVIYNR